MTITNETTIETLIALGIIKSTIVGEWNSKAVRKVKREDKRRRAVTVKAIVHEKLKELLVEAGATVQHRSVWLRIGGRTEFTRDEVLCALRSLREDKVLQNVRTSGNNFQVFWAFVAQPEVPVFSTLEDVVDDKR